MIADSSDRAVGVSSPGIDLVVLTATVSPNVTERLTLVDPGARLKQYQAAIASWEQALEHSGFGLAIVETSGADRDDLLSRVAENKRPAVKTFNFEPSTSQTARGKGAIELGALAFALEQCPEIGQHNTVYKCTGRLSVLNASRVIRRLSPAIVRARTMADRSWVDTRLVGARAAVWQELIDSCANTVDESIGFDLERIAAAHFASRAALKCLAIERFPERPIFAGMSGTSGQSYSPFLARARNALMRPVETVLAEIASRKQV